MTSTFGGLELGKRALFAQRAALNTIGHNIANANTEGYSRQRVNMKATTALPYPSINNDRNPGQVGTGVYIEKIEQLRDQFLDKQYRNTGSELGYWEAKSQTMEQLESILNEPSDSGVQSIMDKFWQSWHDLINKPEDLSAREVVVERAQTVTEAFHSLSGQIEGLREQTSDSIDQKLVDINSYAEQIVNLNKQISKIAPHGYTPNDLFDQRNLLIDKLSKIANVSVKETTINTVDGKVVASGLVNITIGDPQNGGFELVNGITKPSLPADPAEQFGRANLVSVNGGELHALIEAENVTLDKYLGRLNQLVKTFSEGINQIHNSSDTYDLYGNAGAAFFVDPSGSSSALNAANIEVNPDIIQDVRKLAIASQKDSATGKTKVGDGKRASEIAELRFQSMSGLNGSTMGEFYRQTISQLGVESQETTRFADDSKLMLDTVEARRQSVSGVSLDEEMTEMVKYQQAYNAASRTINVMDELLDKLINGTGRAGL